MKRKTNHTPWWQRCAVLSLALCALSSPLATAQSDVLSDDAPPFVFGGVDASVDQATLIDTTGEEIPLELIALAGRDWLLFTQELPVSWATNGEVDFEAVATSGNLELAREQVTSL